MRKDLEKLINIVQDRVVSILITKGYVRLLDKDGPYKFSNVEVTTLGKQQLPLTIKVSDDEIREYMNLWPPGFRSTLGKVKQKLSRFMNEHECTMEEIKLAAQKWLRDKESPYHGKADFFFYKEEKDGEESRCEEYLDLIKTLPKSDYRSEIT